ncbi:hypothetical protein KIN20_018971 [Parelaphostrongylus tenuis]|uniref:Uncharacterized protein n=1 Tax=Parelaphostrongylus tenuis TaxID=148309 RepID=A0AAD5QSJ8_PARTN|nr:hypothetical protein KIN20_018971 [Parelaphostrongylus tenuis]
MADVVVAITLARRQAPEGVAHFTAGDGRLPNEWPRPHDHSLAAFWSDCGCRATHVSTIAAVRRRLFDDDAAMVQGRRHGGSLVPLRHNGPPGAASSKVAREQSAKEVHVVAASAYMIPLLLILCVFVQTG